VSVLSREQAARRERTLLAALLLSAWGPLATGLGVALSRSTTQVADFVRRTVELAALFISWWAFRRLEGGNRPDAAQRARLERMAGLAVAAALGCSGLVTLGLTLSRIQHFQPGGNVYPGLAVAGLGLVTNSWFWRRYALLDREQHSPVIAAQRGLYRAKALADLCVMLALAAVAVNPSPVVTRGIDLLGSFGVAVYLLRSCLGTARASVAREAGRWPV
jgi:divalent metal cation (Fe/Co/Zn/Cd) transporter